MSAVDDVLRDPETHMPPCQEHSLPESNRMQDAYDAFFRAAEHLALVALHDAATTVREECPEAVAMRIDWSDQGDYLEPCAYPLDADGEPIEDDDREEWIEVDNASALDESNRSTWEAYAGVEGRDGRREAEASGYVFPLDAILTDLPPTPVGRA